MLILQASRVLSLWLGVAAYGSLLPSRQYVPKVSGKERPGGPGNGPGRSRQEISLSSTPGQQQSGDEWATLNLGPSGWRKKRDGDSSPSDSDDDDYGHHSAPEQKNGTGLSTSTTAREQTVTSTVTSFAGAAETSVVTATRVQVITVIDPLRRTQATTTTTTTLFRRSKPRHAKPRQASSSLTAPVRPEAETLRLVTAPGTIPQLHVVSGRFPRTTAAVEKRAEVTVTTTVLSPNILTITVTTTVFSTITVAPNANTTITATETVFLPSLSRTATTPDEPTASPTDGSTATDTPSTQSNLPTPPTSSASTPITSSTMTTPTSSLLPSTTIPTLQPPSPPPDLPASSALTPAQIAGIATGATLFVLLLLVLAALLFRRRMRERRREKAQENILRRLGPPTPGLTPAEVGGARGDVNGSGAAAGGRGQGASRPVVAQGPVARTGPGPGPGSGRGQGRGGGGGGGGGGSKSGVGAGIRGAAGAGTGIGGASDSSSSSQGGHSGLTGEGEVRIVIRRPPAASTSARGPPRREARAPAWPLRTTPSPGSDPAGWSVNSERGSEVDVVGKISGGPGKQGSGRAWWPR